MTKDGEATGGSDEQSESTVVNQDQLSEASSIKLKTDPEQIQKDSNGQELIQNGSHGQEQVQNGSIDSELVQTDTDSHCVASNEPNDNNITVTEDLPNIIGDDETMAEHQAVTNRFDTGIPGPEKPTIAIAEIQMDVTVMVNESVGDENRSPRSPAPPEKVEPDYPLMDQGPHNWRRRLKPIHSPVLEDITLLGQTSTNHIPSEASKVIRRKSSKEDRAEDSKIREKMRAKREAVAKKGPVTAKHYFHLPFGQIGSQSPSYIKRRHSFHTHLDSPFTRQVVKAAISPSMQRRKQSGSSSNVNKITKKKKVPTATLC